MTIFLGILGALVAIIILMILFAPTKYDMNRSIVINRPLTEVFVFLKHLRNQKQWSPWENKDPNMKQTYEGVDGTVGFTSRWEGNKLVGTGEQEVTRIVENKEMISELRFIKPWKSQSEGYLFVDEVDDGTKVTWGFRGEHGRPMNAMMLFFNMEKSVGKDFEEGLGKLKNVLEHN